MIGNLLILNGYQTFVDLLDFIFQIKRHKCLLIVILRQICLNITIDSLNMFLKIQIMKNFKILLVAVILTCFVGVLQTKAQAYIERGSQEKYIAFEVDGAQYIGVALVVYQYEYTPGSVFSWVAHGSLVRVYKGGVLLDYIPLPKSTLKVNDAYTYYNEMIILNPTGKVTVSAHIKN